MMFSPGCKCCACNWTFTVTDSCTGLAVPGTVISVKQSGTEIATCTVSGQVASVTQASGGTGYTNGSYTNGTFTGGGGSGGTFSYTVTGGVIQTTLTVTNPGTGYTSAPTPVFSAGSGTGGSATAAIATKCTLNAPLGTYNLTATPPTSSPYGPFTTTIDHTTCGQTTSVALDVDGDHVCRTTCPCKTPPTVIDITFNFSAGYAGFPYPDGPLTWTGPSGGNHGFWPNAWISADFDSGGGNTACLELACDPSTNSWLLRATPTNTFPIPPGRGPIGSANIGPPATCVPFFNGNGTIIGSPGSSWSIIG